MSLARIPRRRPATEKFSVAPARLSPVLRQRLGDAIEALLAVLDAADPDPDLEPDEDLEDDNDRNESEERHVA